MKINTSALALLLGLTLLAAACGKSTGAVTATGEVPTETTTTTVVDPYAIPETIDVAYVQRVLDRLELVRAEVRTQVYRDKSLGDDSKRKLEAIFGGDALDFQMGVFEEAATADRSQFKAEIQPTTIDVMHIVAADKTCVWVETRNDDSRNRLEALDEKRIRPVLGYVLSVRPHDSLINPTPWVAVMATEAHYLDANNTCV